MAIEISKGGVMKSNGSTDKNLTGGWRTFRPKILKDKCKKCGLCWQVCPEGCINKTKDGFFEVDYNYCKGCLICFKECPFKAIIKENEQK